MAATPTAEISQALAGHKAAEAARVAADHDAATAATAAADARAATTADKLGADAARAQQEATRARAALASASPPEESAIFPPPPPHDDDVFRAYVAAQTNAAVVALHAHFVSVFNVKAMIPVFLDILSPHYNRWKTLFLNMLGKYELSDHVLTDITPDVAANPHWHQMDFTICSWLYGIVAPDLIEIASTPTLMARSIWLRLQEQFVGNCETHALIPDVEFHNFIQGNLSISDALSDLREVVQNHSLVLTTLCGLNIRFSHMAAILN
jgi:hypothetical protein